MIEQQTSNITSITAEVGHGNPFSLISIATALGRENLVFLNGLGPYFAGKKHKKIHQKPPTEKELEEYNKNRSGLAGIAYGVLALLEFLKKERFRLQKISDIGIFVQEHLLKMVPESLLRRWFPSGSFLVVPDVEPKKSAVEILNEKKDVLTPVVWNRQAFKSLEKQGLHPVLVAPFLPEGIVGEVDFQKKRLQRKIVVKSSGSGMPKQWIDSLINYSKNHQIPLEVWLPDKKIVVDKDDKDQWVEKEDETFRPKNLEEYARLFYQSLVDAPPEFLISYPSEMVQVAAWMRGRGWKGNFFMLPASATHEEVNARWAKEFLQAKTINFDNLDIESLKRNIDEEAIDKLRRQLGRLSIKEVIFKFVSLGLANDLKLKEAFVFAFGDLERVFEADERLFGFLEKYLPFIRSLYQDSKGKDYTRKVNKGLYLRHILRTMVLVDELYHQLKEKGEIDNLDYETLMMTTALHDVIEIKTKKREAFNANDLLLRLQKEGGFDFNQASLITNMILFLTPDNDENGSYLIRKLNNARRILMGTGLRENEDKDFYEKYKLYFQIIKAADTLAVLEELEEEIERGKWHIPNQSLGERLQFYVAIYETVKKEKEIKLPYLFFERYRRKLEETISQICLSLHDKQLIGLIVVGSRLYGIKIIEGNLLFYLVKEEDGKLELTDQHLEMKRETEGFLLNDHIIDFNSFIGEMLNSLIKQFFSHQTL